MSGTWLIGSLGHLAHCECRSLGSLGVSVFAWRLIATDDRDPSVSRHDDVSEQRLLFTEDLVRVLVPRSIPANQSHHVRSVSMKGALK